MNKHPIIIFSLLSVLSGCGEEKVKTVEYYLQHSKERTELLEKCRNDTKEGIKPNCINASDAAAQERMNNRLGQKKQ